MKTIVIIQARMGSSRLPGKILKPLGKHNVLKYVTDRCEQIKGISNVVVATSTLKQDDMVEEWCKINNVQICRGSEEDVIDRFVQCARLYEPDYIMRVTADCPFVDYELASDVVQTMKATNVDIVDLEGKMPRGLAVELISYNSLKRIHLKGNEGRHREHVTYYAYEFPDEFTRVKHPVPINRQKPEYRITLDTMEDYELLQKIAIHFDNPLVSSVDVIQYLESHPEVARINAHIKQKPVI